MISALTLLDFDRLETWAKTASGGYAGNAPFPHATLPSFLSPAVFSAAANEFPRPDDLPEWIRKNNFDRQGNAVETLKLGYRNELNLGPVLRGLLYELNSGRFLRLLETLTGINGLIGDPHLAGGGLHQYLPGAVLKIHADFNRHPVFNLDRRLNLLLYLNQDWSPDWGGELELWDSSMNRCHQRIAPIGNTCVVFSTTETSFHGMPDPLRCPDGTTRKSLALYYYSNGRPGHEQAPSHSTLWRNRPND